MLVACRTDTPAAPSSASRPASAPAPPREAVTTASPQQQLSEAPTNLAGAGPTTAEPSVVAVATASATAPATRPLPPAFLPLADAKVGEWCRYRMRDDQTEEVRVTAIDAGIVGIELKMFRRGKPLGRPTLRPERADEDPIAAHARRVDARVVLTDAAVEAAGRRWPCRIVTESWLDEGVRYVRRTWCCEALPVYGIVRMEQTADGEPAASMELLDYGPR